MFCMEISRIQLQITSTSCWCCPKNSQSRGEMALEITSGCMWHKGKTLKLKRQLSTPAVAGEIRDQVGFTYSRTFKFILVEIMYCGNQQPPFLDMSLTMENKTLFGIKSHYRDNIKEHTHPGLRMERCSKNSADSSLFTNSQNQVFPSFPSKCLKSIISVLQAKQSPVEEVCTTVVRGPPYISTSNPEETYKTNGYLLNYLQEKLTKVL